MPRTAAYYADVPKNKDLKQVLAENVRAVMAAKKLKQQHVAALAKQRGFKIDQTTVGRIARADIPTTVEKLEALAAGLGLEQPWQALVPDLDPASLPKLAGRQDQRAPQITAEVEVVAATAAREPIARVKVGQHVHEPRAGYRTKKVHR